MLLTAVNQGLGLLTCSIDVLMCDLAMGSLWFLHVVYTVESSIARGSV